MLLLDHIDGQIIHLFPTISLLFLTFLLHINFVPYSLKHFPILLHFSLSTTLNINVTRTLSLHIRFILTLLFTSFYYKFDILSLILYIFSHTKKGYYSLSLSWFFFFFWWIFIFIFCISTLGWWIFVFFRTLLLVDAIQFSVFKLLSFFFYLIVK